jgi:hypothetical protein
MFTLTNGAFDSQLNRLITILAPKHTVADVAPESFESLSRAGKLVVWAGASEGTVYGDALVNYAFRAWHDSLHLKLQAPFTLQGETVVALEQARILGLHSRTWASLVMAEVLGQASYLAETGMFPKDQVRFTLDAMRHY